MKIINDKIEFRDSAEYQDDERYYKIVKRIQKLNMKYLKEYNEKIFNIYENSFIFVETSKLDSNFKNLTYKLDFLRMLLNKLMNEYLIQELSIDEIRQQLLYYVNNANSKDKEDRKYTRKLINYIFRNELN